MDFKRFGCEDDPFAEAPDRRYVYLDALRRRIHEQIIRSIGDTSGLVLLAGETGAGKTTMLHCLSEQIRRRADCYLLSATPWLTCQHDTTLHDLAQAFSYARCLARLGAPGLETHFSAGPRANDWPGSAPTQCEGHGKRRVAVIMLDDAHRLSPKVVVQLGRWRTAFQSVRGPLLAILAGRSDGGASEESIGGFSVEPDSQDMFIRLRPFAQADVQNLIHHRFQVAGCEKAALFPPEAAARIFAAAKGNPAKTIRVCRRALELTPSDNDVVSATVVDAAARMELAVQPNVMADVTFLQSSALSRAKLFGLPPAPDIPGQIFSGFQPPRRSHRVPDERIGLGARAVRLASATTSAATVFAVGWFYIAGQHADRHSIAAFGNTMSAGMSAVAAFVQPRGVPQTRDEPAEAAGPVEASTNAEPALLPKNRRENPRSRDRDAVMSHMFATDDEKAFAAVDFQPVAADSLPLVAEEETAPLAPDPEPVAADPAPRPSTAPSVDDLLERGNALLELGDVAASRLFFEMAFARGSAEGALLMGLTFDPAYFERAGIYGTRPHVHEAIDWYLKSAAMGSAAAREHLNALELRLRQAAQEGDEEAREALKLLAIAPHR